MTVKELKKRKYKEILIEIDPFIFRLYVDYDDNSKQYIYIDDHFDIPSLGLNKDKKFRTTESATKWIILEVKKNIKMMEKSIKKIKEKG